MRWVRLAAICQIVGLVLFAPFAQIPLTRIDGFIPAFEGIVFVTDLITAVLLFSQFSIHRLRALLILACGYLFSALIVIPHGLSFPGAFSSPGLFSDSFRSTGWLYWFWHTLFPLALIGYGLTKDQKPYPAQISSRLAVLAAVALVLALVCGATLISAVSGRHPPALFFVTMLACVGALAVLALRRRSVLDQWLLIVALATILEMALVVVFSPTRFSVGFYLGRLFSLLTSTTVLVVLLQETTRLYASLGDLNETLERRVHAETRERLQIWNVSQDLLVITDLEGRTLGINPTWTSMLGWSEADLLNETFELLVHPDDVSKTRSEVSRLVQGDKTLHFENRFRSRDGAYRWISWAAVADGARIYCTGRDFTAYKRAEEARRESEERWRSAIDGIPGLFAILAPDGAVETVNRQIMAYCGQSAEELRNWGSNGTVHPDDHAHTSDVFGGAIAAGVPYQFELRLRRYDGAYRWFDNRGIPVRDVSGNILRWYVLLTDIDVRKRAEDALNLARSELTHAARVATLGTLTASIAHEINQPLSGILTNAGTSLRMLDADPPNITGARDTANRTIRDANRAADVINRLRSLFKKRDEVIEPVDLNDAAEDIIALSTHELRRNKITVSMDLAPSLPVISGDRVQLQQVILNLLLNASDALSTIETRPRQIAVQTSCDNEGFVSLTVRDNGPGIDVGADKLFEPFYTTKSGGMGIGLSLSRSIIERHGGQLIAHPNEKPGATFSIILPGGSEASAPV